MFRGLCISRLGGFFGPVLPDLGLVLASLGLDWALLGPGMHWEGGGTTGF